MDLSSGLTYKTSAMVAISGGDRLRLVLNSVSSVPAASPQVTLVGDVFLADLRLVEPIVLTLEQCEGGTIVASEDVFYMYGEGNTRQDAVRDYLSSLSEYYELLESYDDQPSKELFSYLQTYLHPRTT